MDGRDADMRLGRLIYGWMDVYNREWMAGWMVFIWIWVDGCMIFTWM